MKRRLSFISAIAAIVLVAAVLFGCSVLASVIKDTIVGTWQQASVNGNATVLVTTVQFTDTTYTGSTAGITTNSGTWTKSGSSYTLTGTFFGFVGTTSTINPTFTDSNNTMTYTDQNGFAEVYNRK